VRLGDTAREVQPVERIATELGDCDVAKPTRAGLVALPALRVVQRDLEAAHNGVDAGRVVAEGEAHGLADGGLHAHLAVRLTRASAKTARKYRFEYRLVEC
jgi:hypothetical protein